MLAALHSRVFFVFALMCALCLAFIWKFVPETRGRTLEEIERELFGSSRTPEAYRARDAMGAFRSGRSG
jgi:predicted MFS family arabinose efflux permease